MDITTTSFLTHEFLYSFVAAGSLFAAMIATFFATLLMLKGRFAVVIMLLVLVMGGGVFLFANFADAASERVEEGIADIEGRAEFNHGITELSPLDGSIDACIEESRRDAAAYAWTTNEGDKVIGHIVKTAETDGECVYSFITDDVNN